MSKNWDCFFFLEFFLAFFTSLYRLPIDILASVLVERVLVNGYMLGAL